MCHKVQGATYIYRILIFIKELLPLNCYIFNGALTACDFPY